MPDVVFTDQLLHNILNYNLHPYMNILSENLTHYVKCKVFTLYKFILKNTVSRLITVQNNYLNTSEHVTSIIFFIIDKHNKMLK